MAIEKLRGVIDDGTREIPLYNKFNKLICKIYIRPADLSILDRYNQFAADFSQIAEPVKKLKNLKTDGTVKFDEEWEVLKAVEAELKRRINALFDMDEADAIFATRNPFSSIGDKFFCENVMTAIGDIILKAVEQEMEQSKARVNKHLADIQPLPTETEVIGDDRTTSDETEGLR